MRVPRLRVPRLRLPLRWLRLPLRGLRWLRRRLRWRRLRQLRRRRLRLPLLLSGSAFAKSLTREAKIDWPGSTIDPANLVFAATLLPATA